MDIAEFYRRYDEALLASELSEAEAMRRAGYPADKIRSARRRGAAPSDLVGVVRIAHTLGVAPFHFLQPLGLNRAVLESPVAPDVASQLVDDPDELAWLGLWRDLDDSQKAIALRIIRNALIPSADIG